MDETTEKGMLTDTNEAFEKYKNKRWVLLALGVLIMVSVSVCYGWSLLSAPISKEFSSWNETMGGFTFTAFMYSYGIFGVVGGVLAQKVKKIHINLSIAALCMGIGFWLSSFAQDFTLLLIGFSLLGGAGAAFAYNAVVVTITKWFPDRVGFATGSVLMGFGMGPFVIGNLYTLVVQGGMVWQNAFQWLGSLICALLIVGVIFLKDPPTEYAPPKRPPKVDRYPVETQEMAPLQMIKRWSFWILFVMGCTATMPSMVYSGFGRQLVQNVSQTVDPSTVALIVGSISLANGIGRVVTGVINDRFGMGFTIRVSSIGVVLGVTLILFSTLMQSLVLMAIALWIAGFTAGMSAPNGALVTRKLYGDKNYQVNLQVLMLAVFVNSLGVTIFGGVYEMSGGFILPLITLIGISCIGFICACLIKKP